MNALNDRRVQIAIGAVIALLLAVLLGVFMSRQPKPRPGTEAKGGLLVDARTDEAKNAQTKPLRCFVNGQSIGDFTVAECSKRNGVAAQALEVDRGPPPSGVAPPPAAAPVPTVAPGPAPAPMAVIQPQLAPPPAASGGECLRFTGGEWRTAGQSLSLGQCVRVLFDGRCVRQGEAMYGRSGPLSVRLVPGRVEVSSDNRSFRTLATQDDDCALVSN